MADGNLSSEVQELIRIRKAELHVHLEGSIRLSTLNRLALKKGLPIFDKTPYEFSNFDEFHNIFPQIGRYFNTEEDFYYITLEFGKELMGAGVAYCETFLMPYVHVRRGIPFDALVGAIDSALSELERERALKVNIICTIPRTEGEDAGWKTLQWMERYPSDRLIGIDLSGKELPGTVSVFSKVFKRARDMGLKTTAHAGEFLGPDAIWETLMELKPDRVGHGINAVYDQKLINELSERNIPLDISLSSNVKLKAVKDISLHPVRWLYEAGVPITINTDDPAFFDTDLIKEYLLLKDNLGFTIEEIITLIEKAWVFGTQQESFQWKLG